MEPASASANPISCLTASPALGWAGIATTKPGALAPRICLLSRGAAPEGAGSAVRSMDRWRLGPGVERDVPWGPGQLRRCSGRHQSPPGICTPGTSHLLKNCSSRDRIVSALLAVAQGGFPPSSDGAVDEATPGARLGTRIHLVFSHPLPELPQPLPSPARQGLRSAHKLPAQPPCSCAPCRSAPPWGGLKCCRLCGAPVQILL